ncbi:MAG: Rpn family recombination-promoting nuclease/putative transposase (plasmid) [Leptolyngbya sp. BL-A-14]
MKTDSLFYRLFKEQPTLVLELIGNSSPRNATYAFVSQEVKQLSFRIDGILNPPLYASDLPIVFVEIQGYPDRARTLYHSFFAEIFLYLRDYQPVNDWIGVIIFTKRSLDPKLPQHFQDYANSSRFKRVYLDRLDPQVVGQSLELSVLQLIGLKDEAAPERARALINRARTEATDDADQQRVIELVLATLVYKFPTLDREAIRQMLGLDELKQTRFYQEVKEEVQDELLARAIPGFLKLGLTPEQIAEQFQVDVPTIERVIREQQNQN